MRETDESVTLSPMPFGPYSSFDDCVGKNGDKSNPEAYCASLERQIRGASARASLKAPRFQLQIVPVEIETLAVGDPYAYIVDIDDTLIREDGTPFPDRIEAVNDFEGEIAVVSGRLEADREATETSLTEAGLRTHRLYLRPDEEVGVVEHKKAVAEMLLEERDVRLAVENDETTRDMYDSLGIPTVTPESLEAVERAEEGDESDEADDSEEIEVEIDEMALIEIEVENEKAEMPIAGEEESPDFRALLVVEGVWTGDGRYIDENALGWRDLPLPLMATDRTTEGHMDAVLIGSITSIEREGREIRGFGRWIPSDDDDVRRLQSLIGRGDLRGVSVDLDGMEYEVIIPATSAEAIVEEDGTTVVPGEEMKMRITSARIMGATVVPFPAFQEAYIESLPALTASLLTEENASGWIERFASIDDIDLSPPQGVRDEAELGLKWREEHGRGGTEVGVARARDLKNGKNLSPETIDRMVSYFARHEVDKQGEGWSPGEDGFPSAGRIAWALWGGDPGKRWAESIQTRIRSRREQGSIVASGHPIEAPVLPPSEWYSNPGLDGPTPLTVDDSGRIYGHLAVWGQCHVGHAGRCVQPPSSATSYAHFLTGEILCEDGKRFPVGQITMDGTHAPHTYGAKETSRHYDNTATAVADVTAGEDDFGIWVSGSIRPGLEPSTIRGLMASDVSGDWRRIGGNLELVAVLAVNVPGFPKIRVREAEGLVASLSLPAYSTEDAIDDIRALAASIGRTPEERIKEATRRVHGRRIAELADRIRGGR
jgi:hypothetical protein